MNRFKIVFFTIITFGIFLIILKAHTKKRINEKSNTINQSEKIDININEFINFLGGKENIVTIASTINSLIVQLKNIIVFDQHKDFKKFKIRGCNKVNNKYIFLIGNNASAIKEKLNETIKL